MAIVNNFNVTQGSQFDKRLVASGDSGVTNLSGYSARGYLKHKYSDTGTLLDLSPTILSGDNGTAYVSGYVDISLLASQTATLPVAQGIYDVEIYKGAQVDKIANGVVNIFPEVTN